MSPPLPASDVATRRARLKEHLDSALAHIRDYAMILVDDEGRIADWNSGAEYLLGHSTAEVIGQPYDVLFTPADREADVPRRELDVASRTGQASDDRWHLRTDGSCFFASGMVIAIRDESGHLHGFVKIFRDLTEQHRAEIEREGLLRQATESNRLKDEFLSMISHELRTPLNAILGWLHLIRLRNTPEVINEALSVIERNARAQTRLIEDLLDVSRIVTGKIQLTLEPVSLAVPLAAAVETVRPAADQKQIELHVWHEIVQDELVADAERLKQVIWNVLSNAIKFTPNGGTIEVRTQAFDDAIEICVQDSGVGVDAEFLPFVFDRFRQADTALGKEHGGLGLGLSIVKHLVELHHGRVSIESPGPGAGTTLRLTLPRSHEPRGEAAGRDQERSAPVSTLTDVNILIVDDDEDARRILELAMTAEGAHVVVAATTRDGILAARSSPPDIVLADLSIPVEDGFALLRQLRRDHNPVVCCLPVVAITAHAHPKDREQCLASGFDAYEPKPLDMNHITAVVAGLVARRRGIA